MKVVLSRKGFDSSNGGIVSPIFEDGTMISFPIPSDDSDRFSDLHYNSSISNNMIKNIIRTVGLEGFENAYPNQLSGGMQQRTAIARALAYNPSFIMMDEPFAALDYFTRAQMQQELIRLQCERGTSICFVTHSIDEALLLGHKIVIIENGQIKSEFSVKENNEDRNLLEPEFIELKRNIIEQLDL